MAGGLDYKNIVDVTSTGVRAGATINKMPTILLEKNSGTLPQQIFTKVNDYNDAVRKFGANSAVANWAQIHFGTISKTGTNPDIMTVYNYVESGQNVTLKGEEITKDVFKINGQFNFIKNGVLTQVEIDFTDLTTYIQCAEALETAIADDVTVTYSNITKGFIITSTTIGNIDIKIEGNGDDNTVKYLGFKNYEVIEYIEPMTFENSLVQIADNKGYYYLIVPNWELNSDEKIALGAFTNSQKDDFFGLAGFSDFGTVTDTSEVKGFNNYAWEYQQNPNQTAFLAGLISGKDMLQIGGNYDISYNDANLFPNAVTKQSEYDVLVENKINFIGKFANMGVTEQVTQKGTCFGTLSDSINVCVGNSFIKKQLQLALFNMFVTVPIVPLRGEQGKTLARSFMNPVFNNGVATGLIVENAELTTAEIAVVNSAFKDKKNAVQQLSTSGYYFEVDRLDLNTRTMYINMAYMANKPLDRLVISNRILGA